MRAKRGGTGGIAERIGEALGEEGIPVAVLPVDRVGNLSGYSAVILGSAVYFGRWRKEAAAFLHEHERELAERPVWLFSSGPTGEGEPVDLMEGWSFPEDLRPVAERIHVRETAYFHGDLDLAKLNIMEKIAIRAVKSPPGDFRDWAAISAWAKGIGGKLRHESDPSG